MISSRQQKEQLLPMSSLGGLLYTYLRTEKSKLIASWREKKNPFRIRIPKKHSLEYKIAASYLDTHISASHLAPGTFSM